MWFFNFLNLLLLYMMIPKVYDILWDLIQKLLKMLNIHNETLQLQRNIMTISPNIIYKYIFEKDDHRDSYKLNLR